ncbi:MAG: histidine phosphatase family protein [Microbacteriaceae bacterium]|nr:histidine phosphatase family protein [Microbacteriaceae bacterium]
MQEWAFMRHGQTDWNAQVRLQGRSDIPLNDVGRQQAREAAAQMREAGQVWDVVVASPLGRAQETAQIVAAELGISRVLTHEGIVEKDFGGVEGTFLEPLSQPERRALTENNGETRQQVQDRAIAAVQELAAAHPGQRLLLVSHGTLIRMVMSRVTGGEFRRLDNVEVVPFALEEALAAAGQ